MDPVRLRRGKRRLAAVPVADPDLFPPDRGRRRARSRRRVGAAIPSEDGVLAGRGLRAADRLSRRTSARLTFRRTATIHAVSAKTERHRGDRGAAWHWTALGPAATLGRLGTRSHRVKRRQRDAHEPASRHRGCAGRDRYGQCHRAGAGGDHPRYTVQDLGTLPGDYSSTAMGINANGDVVGWSAGPTGTRAFLYTNAAGMKALAGPAGRPVTTARAVNGIGTVVGNASTGGSDIGHAVRWQAGVPLDLGTLGTGDYSDARGVNATGVSVGVSHTNGGALLAVHAFRHTNTLGMVDLTPTSDDAHAEAINDAG